MHRQHGGLNEESHAEIPYRPRFWEDIPTVTKSRDTEVLFFRWCPELPRVLNC